MSHPAAPSARSLRMLRPLLQHLADDPQASRSRATAAARSSRASMRPYVVAALLDGVDGPLRRASRARRRRRRPPGARPRGRPQGLAAPAARALLPEPRRRLRVAPRAAAAPRRPARRRARRAARGRRGGRAAGRRRQRRRAEREGPRPGAAPALLHAARRRPARPRRGRRGARRGRLRARRPGRGPRPVRDPRRHPRRLPGDRGPRGARRPLRHRDRVAAPLLAPSRSARWARPTRSRSPRRPSWRPSTASSPRSPRSPTSDERPDVAELLPGRPLPRVPRPRSRRTPRCSSPPRRRSSPALADHWQDVCAAFHDADAHHLYVKPDDDHRRRSTSAPTSRLRARLDRPADRVPRPGRRRRRALAQGGRAGAREARALGLPHGRRVAAPRRGRAHRLQPRAPEGALARGGRARPPRRAALRRRVAARRLHRRRPAPRGHPRAPPLPPQARRAQRRGGRPRRGALRSFADLRTGEHVVHEDHGVARFAGFETKTVGGVTRDYLQLEFAGDDKVYMPVDQLAKITPLHRRGRRSADAEQARRQELGDDEGARPPRRAGARRRAAQPLRRAPPPPRPRLPGGLRVAARVRGEVPLPGDRRPARGDRGASRPTWSARSRWTA